MKLYFKQEMQYFYDKEHEYPAYLIAMGEHCGFPFYVKNLNGCHPTAYVQVPSTHPMYGKRLTDEIPLDVHFRVTYAESSLLPVATSGWFIGWDYGHCTDFMGYYKPNDGEYLNSLKKWTVDEIIEECMSACEQLEEMEK